MSIKQRDQQKLLEAGWILYKTDYRGILVKINGDVDWRVHTPRVELMDGTGAYSYAMAMLELDRLLQHPMTIEIID